jgi:hypothetical protein
MNSVADPLDIDPGWKKIRIRDKHPYLRELSDNFLG